ncbi:dihydropyrimidinase [Lacrimispora sp. 210928-DFI.3.58]|uniref:dihydropyrimidinase n=1 Tax=Lacrimispora sp. 210928-DFI.3.58 TaxID=2883214 RepID=UPI001D07EE6B|nr:dihydropyrimidinase [Lacrimispora sp. 210928-DFI.3.58]MCB7318407.1 dihydropyrimidinase [Lacrimispora sp. 210928-DFI.3.58]
MRQIIKGGTVVTGSGSFPADVLIEGEKILAVGTPSEMERLGGEEAVAVDAEGCLLFPGFIDAHTHFDLHVAGTVTADDFATGTKAALRGGTTSIIDFGTQYPGESLAEGLKNWHEKADGKCSCDYGFHMSITEWTPSVCEEVQDMMDQGITSFKLYMTYDTQVDDETIFKILRRLKEVGGITGVHCENSGMIAALQEEAKKAGRLGVESHPATRPDAAEAEAIGRLLRLAEVADVPVVVVHLTCKAGYDVIMEARRRGQRVYTETCPQYLLMDDSLYSLPGTEGLKYVCAPPLRKKEDQDCLWRALEDGTIQTVSTDHCSFTTGQKLLGKDDFTKIPGGMPGVETRGTLLYTFGVDAGRISKETMCRVLSENPAKLYGLYPKKGVIAPGSDADIVILRTGVSDTITAADQIQNVDYAPFEGTKVTGCIERVFLRGTQAVKDGQVVEPGLGRFLERGKYEL